jgi:hypothetical protein
MDSPITGADGNREFLLGLNKAAALPHGASLRAATFPETSAELNRSELP